MTEGTLRHRAERWRDMAATGQSDEALVRGATGQLLRWLFDPDPVRGWVVSDRVDRVPGLADDAINWGDLHVVEVVKRVDGTFEVVIEEASSDAVHLQEFVRTWLSDWGWEAEVRTEW